MLHIHESMRSDGQMFGQVAYASLALCVGTANSPQSSSSSWNCRSSRLLKMIVRTSSLHEVESHHRLIDGKFEPAEARHPLCVTILSGKRSNGKHFLGVFLSKTGKRTPER